MATNEYGYIPDDLEVKKNRWIVVHDTVSIRNPRFPFVVIDTELCVIRNAFPNYNDALDSVQRLNAGKEGSL